MWVALLIVQFKVYLIVYMTGTNLLLLQPKFRPLTLVELKPTVSASLSVVSYSDLFQLLLLICLTDSVSWHFVNTTLVRSNIKVTRTHTEIGAVSKLSNDLESLFVTVESPSHAEMQFNKDEVILLSLAIPNKLQFIRHKN